MVFSIVLFRMLGELFKREFRQDSTEILLKIFLRRYGTQAHFIEMGSFRSFVRRSPSTSGEGKRVIVLRASILTFFFVSDQLSRRQGSSI